MPETFIRVFVFVFGTCIGSFLNVCIYRLPTGISVITPPSRCPWCDQRIRFYDNIPIISYLLLRGRCRHCAASFSPRYLLVELLTGLTALAVYFKSGLTPHSAVLFVFLAALIVIIFIDIDHRIIPDIITLPGIILFFIAAVTTGELSWQASLIGIVTGGGSLYLVALIYKLLTKTDGMGGGDIKLIAMIGAWCGWQGVFFTIMMSSLVGTVVGFILMAVQRKNMKLAVPFGPFLSLGAIAYIFFGPDLIYWYFDMLTSFQIAP
jgi:leader peptidase (prepilin peptidase) / N-methyltransferase